MIIQDLEDHLTQVALAHERIQGSDNATYILVKDVKVNSDNVGVDTCDVAILYSAENPWVPQSAVHVRPVLVPMGEKASQTSGIGPEWQYLSRRFERPPTPQSFFSHILTVLQEL